VDGTSSVSCPVIMFGIMGVERWVVPATVLVGSFTQNRR
jgi:hypothetical protein